MLFLVGLVCWAGRAAAMSSSSSSRGRLSAAATARPSVVGLERYAVKGLCADAMEEVTLKEKATMPHDRRWALRAVEGEAWDGKSWLHKSNFMCAFSATTTLPRYVTRFDDGSLTLSGE